MAKEIKLDDFHFVSPDVRGQIVPDFYERLIIRQPDPRFNLDSQNYFGAQRKDKLPKACLAKDRARIDSIRAQLKIVARQ